ncbi:MAG: type secretion protein VgrG [Rhodocyclaceae bacterium]|nr:type secretion protein VgrG [Rhodocyclaceae bacterium]
MPVSPNADSDGPVKLVIKANGQAIADTLQVLSVTVQKAINKVPRAEIVLLDGDMPTGAFPASEGDSFKPGGEITISAGYGQNADLIFSGVVVGQRLSIDREHQGLLTVDCRDKAAAMTVGRKNANFVDKKDSDIATKLIGDAGGLSADVGATDTQWKELVQYYCTDWDFLIARAEVNGFVVIVNDGKVSFKAPDTSAAAALKVTFGTDLVDLQASLEARDQLANVKATAWDIKNQKVMAATAPPQSLNVQGNLDSSTLAKVLGVGTFGLQTSTTMESGALKAWAKAQQVKSGLSRLRGSMRFQGSAKAKAGGLIELAGVGKRFNGNVYVTAVTHEIRDGDWLTRADFGLSPTWYAEGGDLEAPAASGLLPGIEGLHIGVVMKLEEDPDGQFKVQVSTPVMQAETDGVWARLMQFHATSGKGAFFLPEIGDEVVLGYFNNDPSAPVILGSLYSSKRKPPYTPANDNYKKAITTRTGLTLEYDDEKKVITLVTPGKNKIVISDDDKSILLADQNGNTVKLGTDGISLDSPKDIKLSAQGKISLSALANVEIKATQDAKMEGMNVSHSAQIGFTAKGNATAELSASGQTTVKGALVMIN